MAEDDAEQAAAQPADGAEQPGRRPPRAVRSVRVGVACVLWLVAVLAALVLAAGALVVALDLDRGNSVVSFVVRAAGDVNFLGTPREFQPSGTAPSAVHAALVDTVLVSWGICAIAYLVLGKILDRIVRP
jgi:hypothetical protein